MLSLIAAVARRRIIGKDNALLWQLPGDMRHFRETTRGKPVVMGRKTWESLPEKFRPLPGRLNVVVTRQTDYVAPGGVLAASLDEALAIARRDGGADTEIFVIGGGELYRQALPLADRLHLTEIAADFDGDTLFPDFSGGDWQEASRSPLQRENGLSYTFAVYQRTQSTK